MQVRPTITWSPVVYPIRFAGQALRRAYLCGPDPLTDQNHVHSRQWIENRIRILSSLFAIDICAYAVMSNHLHLVVKLCPNERDELTDADIVERWTSLFKGPLLVQRWRAGEALGSAELQAVSEYINGLRSKLGDLSCFMKCLNEPIARLANKEDKCTCHFILFFVDIPSCACIPLRLPA